MSLVIMNAVKNVINDEAATTGDLAILGPKITASLTYISGLIKSS